MDKQTLVLPKCPSCKSKKVWKSGFAITTNGKKQLFQCKKCGRKFRENDE